MITNCAICNKEIDRKPSHIKKYKHLFCSDECKRKGATLKIIEKYKEYLQIEDMKEWLYQRYIVERLSIRQIMKLLNTNANKGISSMLEFYGIEIRHGSEAIETQWENNEERRKEQAKLIEETLLTEESRNKLREVMQSNEYKESLSNSLKNRTINNSNSKEKCYEMWHSMIQRCTCEKFKLRCPSYKDCKVNDEWKDYNNFSIWFDKNYYSVDNERMHLDKDILFKNNNEYGPNKCIIVPERINLLFRDYKLSNKENLIGIRIRKNRYEAVCARNYLGSFKNVEEAIIKYNEFKKEYTINIIEEYKEKIPEDIYNKIINAIDIQY